MTLIWGFDFGQATGVSLGEFTPATPYRLIDAWQVEDGTDGFIDWWGRYMETRPDDVIVAERFVLNPGNEFVADLEGLRAEGALQALCARLRLQINWQERGYKTGVKDAVLVAHGLWQDILDDHTDGRDANDAIIHSLAYLKTRRHMPTLRKYFKED